MTLGQCRPLVLLTLFVTCGLVVSTVFVLRPAGLWAETDTATLALAIQEVTDLAHIEGYAFAYPHGYAYQAVATALMAMSGITAAQFQQLVSPFLFPLLLLPTAWVAYREVLDDELGASLATAFLLLQPEILFISLRGSHEKVTRALVLLALFLLARSLRPGLRTRTLAWYLVLYYLVSFGILASNNLFASSFFAALAAGLAVGLAGGALHGRWRGAGALREVRYLNARLLYSTAVLFALSVIFTFYVYPPAAGQISLLRDVWERLGALLLRVERPTSPYAVVAIGWVSLPAFLLVSLPNWLVLGGSGIVWLKDTWTWFIRRPDGRGGQDGAVGPPSRPALLLWLLYGAFAFQEVAAVAVDFSGAIAANFQHRAFASFSLVAVAVLARGLVPAVRAAARAPWGAAPLAAAFGALALLSALKATNEPLLSNKWMFYTADELRALRWTDAYLADAGIWTDFDERLTSVHALAVRSGAGWGAPRPVPNYLDAFVPKEGTRDALVSDVVRRRAVRLGTPLPVMLVEHQTYDNGTVGVFHLRPSTPYQR